MFDVCPECGAFDDGKPVDPDGPALVCPECGHAEPFRREPLLVVSGAAGSGKSTVLRELRGTVGGAVLLDGDVLWRESFDEPGDDYRDFFETWLRLCRDIAQSGRPPVLFNAGAGVPENVEQCPQHRCFSRIDRLALVCADEALRERLRARPEWRGSSEGIDDHVEFNRWFREHADGAGIELVDTTDAAPAATANAVREWIEERAA